jgi:hypothetical protein
MNRSTRFITGIAMPEPDIIADQEAERRRRIVDELVSPSEATVRLLRELVIPVLDALAQPLWPPWRSRGSDPPRPPGGSKGQ